MVINNAGVAGTNRLEADAPLAESDDLWRRIIDVNVNGTYYVTRYALPLLTTGRVINIASVLGHKGVPDATAYCASKHAVIGFTRSLAHALAPRGITVNSISPGWTETDMAAQRLSEIGISAAEAAKGVPIGRLLEPSEIARMALFLASPEAGGITGQDFVVDGGVLA